MPNAGFAGLRPRGRGGHFPAALGGWGAAAPVVTGAAGDLRHRGRGEPRRQVLARRGRRRMPGAGGAGGSEPELAGARVAFAARCLPFGAARRSSGRLGAEGPPRAPARGRERASPPAVPPAPGPAAAAWGASPPRRCWCSGRGTLAGPGSLLPTARLTARGGTGLRPAQRSAMLPAPCDGVCSAELGGGSDHGGRWAPAGGREASGFGLVCSVLPCRDAGVGAGSEAWPFPTRCPQKLLAAPRRGTLTGEGQG